MKRYRVDVDVKATETYYITAKNKEGALQKAIKGDHNKNDYSIDIHSSYWKDADISEE